MWCGGAGEEEVVKAGTELESADTQLKAEETSRSSTGLRPGQARGPVSSDAFVDSF